MKYKVQMKNKIHLKFKISLSQMKYSFYVYFLLNTLITHNIFSLMKSSLYLHNFYSFSLIWLILHIFLMENHIDRVRDKEKDLREYTETTSVHILNSTESSSVHKHVKNKKLAIESFIILSCNRLNKVFNLFQ